MPVSSAARDGPSQLADQLKASLSIGVVSFVLPFVGAFLFCVLALGWRLHAAEVGGVALSTTSVAVVYAVMVETGLNRQELGKLILAACVILSAFVPTVIAQQLFKPEVIDVTEEEALGEEDLSIIHRRRTSSPRRAD